MVRLTSQLCSLLTDEVLEKLKTAGVTNTLQFMMKNGEKLAKESNVSYKDLQSIRKVIHAHSASFPVTGSHLLDESFSSMSIISTGNKQLDNILGGGFITGEIIEIFGKWGLGKSTLCLNLALHAAIKEDCKVFYIDTSGAVASKSMTSFLENKYILSEISEKKLNCFKLIQSHDIWDLLRVLQHLLQSNLHETFNNTNKGNLIIIDSLYCLLNPLLYKTDFKKWSIVEQVANCLKQLTSQSKVVIVVVNSVKYNKESSNNAALGKYWSHVPHTRLFLEQSVNPWSVNELSPSSKSVCVHIIKSTRLKISSSKIDFELVS